MTTALHSIAFKARSHPRHRFQNLYGLLNSDLLYQSWGQLNKQAAAGIDGITMPEYRSNLVGNIQRVSRQLQQKCYRASAIKRIFIPKANGKQRPLGLPTVDDKLVQQSVSQILQSIWEGDFLPNSYGYRPNKSAHQAVHSLGLNLQFKGYGYIVEADIKGFFDNMNHAWLVRMLEQRIDDKALLSLIKQWLKARVKSPDGVFSKPTQGSPQGSVVSPVLANIYLHYALDLWFERKVKPRMNGRAMLIRYADDFVVAFQLRRDAERFYRVLPKRLDKFGLNVAPEKTHLKRFSRFHPGRKRNFQFLGFEFYWSLDVNKKPRLRRRTASKKQKATMSELYQWIKLQRSKPLRDWMPSLKRKLTGFRNYFGLPDNSRSLSRLFKHLLHSLYKWLNRRSQRRSYNWNSLKVMLGYFQIEPPRVSKRLILVDWY
ncbi:group II intron reverse transcriptase/maturase [Marinobacterium sedimentorum]|uniref:group II intron reverse transcriptase/maturase n=1 Tax=Marinobacterium sedimentorum TaxID=2927804 RepID=UPI0020C65D67|nr:group II intron reverse transcriptase/maturase [Marinobacterium sedimentorum]MCP8690529.1 group II intron reverse transcriptase/maturase [Marinobacterium sedimentorum]